MHALEKETRSYFKLPKIPPALVSVLEYRNPDFHRNGHCKWRTKLNNYLYKAISMYTMYVKPMTT